MPDATLHVANDTSPTSTTRDAGIPGRYTSWADPLHDGPVPALARTTSSCIRVRYLADEAHGIEAIASEMRRWREAIDDYDAPEQALPAADALC